MLWAMLIRRCSLLWVMFSLRYLCYGPCLSRDVLVMGHVWPEMLLQLVMLDC